VVGPLRAGYREHIGERLATTLQRYITGDLGGLPGHPAAAEPTVRT
jgi:hypothetical protein